MATSDNDSPPVYREIADTLREEIRSGRLSDGARVPGENDLMKQYGVARATARQALSVLINEGIVVAIRGSGIYVRAFRPLRRHGPRRLSRALWGSGRAVWQADAPDGDFETDSIEVGEVPAPGYVAKALGLAEDTLVVRRHRRYRLGGRPMQLATSYLPAKLAAGTAIAEADTGPGGIYARLAELGRAPAHFTEEIRVRMPTPDEARELRLSPGTPVMDVLRTALTAEHEAVEFNEMTLDGSAYVLQYDFDA
ncbi:GntR family transcriptional regulator [Streptomonospora sp. S1-112]|uniref:GntR family transcriptional regulator n=1 Tax=Streptomonospora mangrovi TaxID=2883123 RepID=A0A9X3NZK3_9ACTN|nr:GntR family transcriptional regulator [Streptomonospora mangrovi]MDA0567231.1 GntR family transcriptional regulator [Streptomonospora mangrovi]